MGGFPHIKRVFTQFFKTIFPPACPFCLTTLSVGQTDPFCPTCSDGIHALTGACCSSCALPFVGSENSSHLCSRCLVKTPPFNHVYAYGYYEQTLRQMIHQFKFNNKVGLDRHLVRLVVSAIDPDLSVDLVIPVPLQRKSLQRRSYNQSLLLAREIARIRHWNVEKNLLKKIKETAPQHDLTARQREQNLRNAFHVRYPLSGEHVLLVDDVMTTGVTVSACSEALLAAGAGQVDVAVIARAAR
jgi:ComF family protein